ncbi:MAG TPA: hypothetical protein DDZ76_07285 [Xanthomonadales bacterium]|nr:hypothetical protein [Xanthomonadales bacterium]
MSRSDHPQHRPTRPRPADHGSDSAATSLLQALKFWLAIGATLVAFVPAARSDHEWIGWLPFWLVLAPASSLAVAYRQPLIDLSKRILTRAGTRQAARTASPPPRRRPQARRSPTRPPLPRNLISGRQRLA